MAKTVVALYDDLERARDAVEEVTDLGCAREGISVVAHDLDNRFSSHLPKLEGGADVDRKPDAPSTGTGVGAAVGAIAGLLAGLGSITVEGIGAVVASGPLIGTLTGASVGAVTGGLVGVLVEAGVPEEDAHVYTEAVRRGTILVTARCPNRKAAEIAEVFARHGSLDIETCAQAWRSEGWRGYCELQPYSSDVTRRLMQRERERMGTRADAGRARTYQARSFTFTPTNLSLGGNSMNSAERVFREHEKDFRRHFEKATPGVDEFDTFRPAYEYGVRLGVDADYARRRWTDLEPEARRLWKMESEEDATWDAVRDLVRFGWERAKSA